MVAFREESSVGKGSRLTGNEQSRRSNENTLTRFNPAYTYPQFLRMSLSDTEVLTIHIFLEEQNLEQEN